MRSPEDDEGRPGGRAASSNNSLGGGSTPEDINFDQLAEDHRLLIGAIINASPTSRGRVFTMLAPGDLDTPIAADALEILRTLHNDGVIDGADLTQQFAATVNARQRTARRPGDPIPVRYPVGPITWMAHAYADAARLAETGAPVMAMPYAGTGRRRAIADAADRLARVARSEADDQDVAAMVDALNQAVMSW